MSLDELIKKYQRRILLLASFVVLGFPFTLHALFKVQASISFFVAEWTIGELLIYGASIFQATATIIAIMLTIRFSIENQKEERLFLLKTQKDERRLSVMPYLYTECHELNEYKCQTENRRHIILIPKHAPMAVDPQNSYKVAYSPSGDSTKDTVNKKSFLRKHYVFEYYLSNVGANSALNVHFEVKDDKQLIVLFNGTVPSFALPKDRKHSFVFILLTEQLSEDMNEMSLEFRFLFHDVASISKYEQRQTIKFTRCDNGRFCISQDDVSQLGSPNAIDF